MESNIKKFLEFNENLISEEFDPMIDNFLHNPIMIALAASWLINGNLKLSTLKGNLNLMKDDFLDYCNLLGYYIDKEVLNSKFEQLIDKVKKILKL